MDLLTFKASPQRVSLGDTSSVSALTRSIRKEPTDDDVAAAERSLAHIREDLDRRRSELGKDTTQVSPAQTFLVRLLDNHCSLRRLLGSPEYCRHFGPTLVCIPRFETELYMTNCYIASAQELRGLEALEADMAQNAAAIQQRRALAVAASTPLGRIQTLSGRVLAVYCVIRLVSVSLPPV
jgi:hypothetical protein